MPFYGPLQLSAPLEGGDPRLTAFIRALQSRGAQSDTAFGPGVGASPGQSESLTGLLSSQQAALGLGRQDGGGGPAAGAGFPASVRGGMAGGASGEGHGLGPRGRSAPDRRPNRLGLASTRGRETVGPGDLREAGRPAL